ncbi:MAG TPA: hypothetical protein VFK18_06145 [Luteimonas sp.]|nr:hypothetical protein [Luteimonas sp.]
MQAARPGCFAIVLALAAPLAPAQEAPAPEAPALTPAAAEAVFDRAEAICRRDNGQLWGTSLCGPIMLVDPASRRILASSADAEGQLQAEGAVFSGQLPPDQVAANTALDWAGVRWTQLLWPVPEGAKRDLLLAHELFHRIQPGLAIGAQPGEGGNAHLDTMPGRVLMQLEWRALAAALQAGDDASRRLAIADALGFRAARHARFDGSAAAETALELNEGLAEYTGVVAGTDTADARIAAALGDLRERADNQSFVRAFAYATGPAYGLLLDALLPGWRARLADGPELARLLAEGAGIEPTGAGTLTVAESRYDGAALRAAEAARDQARQQRLRADRARFIEGAVVRLPLQHMKVRFDPRTLQPLDGVGTVYPSLRVSDDWGTLEASDGALLLADWSEVILVAPEGGTPPISGPGWTLDLAPGWKLVPADRPGDWTLRH